MISAHLSPAERIIAERIADMLFWSDDDRAADAVLALIEASMLAPVSITTEGNVSTLHFQDLSRSRRAGGLYAPHAS